VSASDYINEIIDGSNSMKKDMSVVKLLAVYLDEKKEDISNDC